ncbi:MAG: carboxypeptidase regulatory-like domain-containing protein [Methanomicrobiales archaeon]|nr:carboxypeptidase regulatory-like domain-containing protein [Methanomicrobiales archaeon]
MILSFLCCTVEAVTLDITVRDDDDNSRIAYAYIYIDDEYVGKTDDVGEFSYSHSYDEPFLLEVVKSGYGDWSETIDEDDTSVNVYLTYETATLLVSVLDADTIEPVSDARVKVTAEGTGESESEWVGSSGEAEFELTPDETYTLEITSTGYETVTRTIEADEREITLRCWLMKSDRFSFKVLDADDKTPLSDASVSVDGSLAGVTGTTGILTAALATGRYHDIRVVCPGYSSFQQNAYFEEDEILMEISLAWSGCTVTVSVTDGAGEPLANAAVSVDGAAAGMTDSSGRCTLTELGEGSRTIEVAKDGYDTWKETRTIGTELTDIAVSLAPATTAVTVLVEEPDHRVVSGALIALNGEKIGVTDDNGQVQDTIETSGACNFTASLRGYLPASVEKTIIPGTGALSVTITLHRENDLVPVFIAAAIAAVMILVLGIRWRTAGQYLPRQRRGKNL